MKLKLDLHIHTFHSSDSVNTFKEINKRCYEEGLDGYAICDHDSIKGYDSAFMKKGDLILVPGVEITARGAHILCFNPNDSIQRNLPISETVDKIHDQGALAVLAHPYGIPRSIVRFREAEETGFDAIEVANAAQIPYSLIAGYNRDLANRLQLPHTGGSDSHIPRTVGRAYTIIDAESRDIEDILKAIKSGKTEACGSGTMITERFEKSWLTLKKHFFGFKDEE